MKSRLFFLKNALAGIVCLLLCVSLGGYVGYGSDESSESGEITLEALDELMEVKTVGNSEKAAKGYEKLLKKHPRNPEILYKLANAYIVIIDIKTHALMEEKDEYKPLLEKLGKVAYDYACLAMEINPKSKEAVGAALVAYGYYSASFGIIKAVFKGAAGRYKDLANQLIEIDDVYDGALGYRSLGKLYEVAPWPVGSDRKALKYFKKAVQADPEMLYSHYYLGYLYYEDDEFELAKGEFSYVVENPPHPSEGHFIKAYVEASRKYLNKITEKRK